MTEKLDNLVEKALSYKIAFPVLAIFFLAFGLRYYPARNMEYLQALDPYNLFRMSQQIAYTGHLPPLDFMRYFPYALPTYTPHQLDLWAPAILYRFGGFMMFENYLQFAKFITPLFSAVSAATIYFIGKEFYDKYAGLGAAFFFAVVPGAMHRGSAGFFEKEPVGTMFMVISILFFTLAWKRKKWAYGVISGLSLAFFSASWGGSQMLWLLYPMIIGFVLLINESTENMIVSYTPTVLIGVAIASVINPNRFFITGNLALMNLGFLGLLWFRYSVGQLELLDEKYMKYLVPSAYGGGALALALAPLYSQTIANITLSIYRKAVQTGGGTIGATVAENAPATMSDIVTQIGSGFLAGIFPGSGFLSSLFGIWTLTFISFPLMITGLYMMLGKKYGLIESLKGKQYYSILAAVIASWAIGFTVFYEGFRLFGLIIAGAMSIGLSILTIYLDEDSGFTLNSMVFVFAGLISIFYAFGQNSPQQTASVLQGITYPVWISITGLATLYYTDSFRPREINIEWYKVIPLFWIGSNVLMATARSRLIYLATFPAVIGAGYALSRVARGLKDLNLSDYQFKAGRIRPVLFGVLAVGIIGLNVAGGFLAVQGISGSPNQAWMQNLDYQDQELPPGSTVMSWWDYGYHFQSLGRTASIADGGNFGYYTENSPIVNYPLAEYFASNDTRKNFGKLYERHSVDYVVLDNTMIGKYSAVSQIANRDNQNFNSMLQASTAGTVNQATQTSGNETVVEFRGNVGRPASIYVPVNGSEISGSATIDIRGGGSLEASCVLKEGEPIQEYGDNSSRFCIAQDPFYSLERGQALNSRARIALIPRDIADHNLMTLYLRDGHGMEYLEKVEQGSNGFIKMWEVTE